MASGENPRSRGERPSGDAHLRALFDHSRDAIYLHDLEGRFLQANPAALEMLGYAPAEILSLDFASLLTSEADLARAGASMAALVATGRQQQAELYQLRRKDGETVWVEVLGTLLRDAEEPAAILGIARDVSERKRAEAALRESEERFRTAVMAAPFPIMIHAQDGAVIAVNDAWTAMSGWAPSEFPTLQDWIARAHGADRETVGAHLASIHTGDALRREEELLVTTRFGETRTWVWASAPLSRSPDGRSLAISVATDVTEQRRDEAELRLQVAALNSAADAIVITNRAGKIEWVNRAFTRLSGYPAAEAIGRSPGELVKSGVHPDSFYTALWETILSGNVWRGEVTNRRRDGSLYPESLTITPVVGENGDTAHFVAIKRDLTELKQLEAQYRQAQKMESIGRLAGGIAHDFNNLLTVIIGRAELVLSRLPEDDPNRNGIRQIHEAGERAARLTRQLLAFSRKQILQPAVIDVGHLVLDWRGVLDRLIGEAIELVVTAPENAGRVKADPGQLEQVIMNLVVNARDAMPDGGRLTIEVRSESQAVALPSRPPGRYVVLAVSDTGTGMDAATLEQVFEPFFTTKGPGEGTGLGLATVYGIVRQSEGYLGVESRVGVGTTFTLSLPRVDDEPAAVTDGSAPARRGAETVLVVEDEAALRELAESVLDSAGYRVLTAAHGREAIECLEREGASVDLVFTDVVLPGMNGRNLAEHVARTHPEIRVLFTSGYTGDAELRDGVLKSSAHFLAKPYTVAQLLAAVRDVLDAPR